MKYKKYNDLLFDYIKERIDPTISILQGNYNKLYSTTHVFYFTDQKSIDNHRSTLIFIPKNELIIYLRKKKIKKLFININNKYL
jgi:hypothetical protein